MTKKKGSTSTNQNQKPKSDPSKSGAQSTNGSSINGGSYHTDHRSGWKPSWFLSLIVALIAFGFGILTPPLLRHSGVDKIPLSEFFVPSSAQKQRILSQSDKQSDHDNRTVIEQKHPCTPTLLNEFLHEEFVRGFHILCFDIDQESSQPGIELNVWRGGIELMHLRHQFDQPLSFNSLKDHLQKELKIKGESEMKQAWAFFSPLGERILDEHEQEQETGFIAYTLASKVGMVLLYEGGQFLWPGVRIGFERQASLYSIMPPGSPSFGDKNVSVTLETLSLSPLVLSVKGFLSEEECNHVQEVATPTMRYSDVVLMDRDKGKPASDFRTSQTTFISANDEILKDIDYRTASLVRIPRNHQETVQVLRYGNSEHYTSHHDYFDPRMYQTDKRTLQLIRNGRRNRMATVFWYLSDVDEGGETVFPRFNGGREKSTRDCETGLKVKPERGKVIIFYSMSFNGQVDPSSLHGACPVKSETDIKWAANKWVWNEPMKYVKP